MIGDAYPPGTNDADIERAFGDEGEEPISSSPFPASGQPWKSAEDDLGFGDPDARYVIVLVFGNGAPREMARRRTLAAARFRRGLTAQIQAERGYKNFAVMVWDSWDYERGDLSTTGEREGEI